MDFVPLDKYQKKLFKELFIQKEHFPNLMMYLRPKIEKSKNGNYANEIKNILEELVQAKLLITEGKGWRGFPIMLAFTERGNNYFTDEDYHKNITAINMEKNEESKKVKKMKPKYQIFVSSTKEDMEQERLAVTMQILKKQHIPLTMEGFVNPNQADVIKLIQEQIDACDIFLLVLGGRYGWKIPKSAQSYVDFEFEYAQKKKKPIIAIIIDDTYLKYKKAESAQRACVNGSFRNPYEGDDLQAYKMLSEKVSDKGKTAGFYSDIGELKNLVSEGIDAIIDDKLRNDLGEGWIKADSAIESNNVLLQEYFIIPYAKEFYEINNENLVKCLKSNTYIDKYDRRVIIDVQDDQKSAVITTTTTVKFSAVGENVNYFSANPRFNHLQEAESYKHISFYLNNSKNLSETIETTLIDKGEESRWRYMVENKFPLSTISDVASITHKIRFTALIENFLQANQIEFPCRDYGATLILKGNYHGLILVTTSYSGFNVYSNESYEHEQTKEDEMMYLINLPKWSLPGSGYVFTIQKNSPKN